jgi:prevent-host-death family protein
VTTILVDYNRGQNMETLSLSEAKMKLSELIEKVQSTDAEVVITKNGRPAAVLVSPDEFESWRETIAIKADGDLMSEIKKGIAALKKKPKVYTLKELFD